MSGKKTEPTFGNFPIGGETFVTLEQLKEMVERGDNIITAKYLEGMKMLHVRFETFSLNNSHKHSK